MKDHQDAIEAQVCPLCIRVSEEAAGDPLPAHQMEFLKSCPTEMQGIVWEFLKTCPTELQFKPEDMEYIINRLKEVEQLIRKR